MKRKVALALALGCVWAQPAIAGEQLLFGPVPDWVVPVTASTPAATGEQAELPVRVLLIDRQTRFEQDRQVTYSLIRLRIQSSQGLSAGNVALPWRPEFDDLTVNRLAILRGDQVIDVLASGQTFTTLRREQNLEQSVLDGVLTAHLLPEDLQVGDVVEIATTVSSRDPVHKGHAEASIGPLNGPMERVRMRISWPQSLPLRLERTADLPAWKRSRDGTWESAELDLRDLRTLPAPDGAPPRYSLVKFAQVSDFANWGQLAAIHAPLYAAAARIPADGSLRTELETIRSASADPLARAQAVLQLVQKRVRYVALAMGEGGYVPADAATTWSRRFGDCKGKTALLLALLQELGIEAEPVLVHSQLGDWLPARLPSISAFDHVLVRARIGGTTYWLDGTRSGDTALDALDVPFFRWGLPLAGSAPELVPMVPAPRTEPDEDIAIHFDASKGVKAPAPARLELVMRGDTAVQTNAVLGNYAGEDRQRVLREFWHNRFDFITPESVEAAFDENTRTLRLALTGSALLKWDGVWYETDETGVGYRADFKREPGPGADASFAVTYPYFSRTRQTIQLPPGFTATSIRSGDPVDETVAGVEYRRSTSLQGNTFTVERSERTVATEFPASQAPAFEKRLRELREKRVYLRIPEGYKPTEADLEVALRDPPKDEAGLISQGNMLLSAGKNADALRMFEQATEVAPQSGNAWANKAVALAWLQRLDEALAAADKAEELDPRNFVIFNARGLAAEIRRDWQAARTAFTRAIELNPQHSFAYSRRAAANQGLQKPEAALADVTEAIRISPKWVQMYGIRAQLLTSMQRRAEAEQVIEAMLAAAPDDSVAIGIASQAYTSLGKPERARQLSAQAADAGLTAPALLNRSQARPAADLAGKLADLDEALQLDPRFTPALSARAKFHFASGNLELALKDATAAIAVSPEDPMLHASRANILNASGRRDEAAAQLDALLTAKPGDILSHYVASLTFAGLALRDRALAVAQAGLAIRRDPSLYYALNAAREPDDYAARLGDMREAARIWPDQVWPLLNIAMLLVEKGDFTEAVTVYDQAIAMMATKDAATYGNRGIALWKAGERTRAEADFDEARRLAVNPQELNSLCYNKAEAGVALDRALAECDAALAAMPDMAMILDSRGAVLLRLGRDAEARQAFDQALTAMPQMTNTRYLRAVVRSRAGDFAGAEEDLAMVRRTSPSLIADWERKGVAIAKP